MTALFSGQWPILPLLPSCFVRVMPHKPAHDSAIQDEIERIWADACRAIPSLFNGCVFSATRITSGCIDGYWTEYKSVLAQMKKPELSPILRLQPLAVIGLLETPEGFVLGRRHPSSLYQGNFWQSPPAGSIEKRGTTHHVDLKEQLLAEAEEELGLTADLLEIGAPRLVARHPGTRILDIGMPLKTHCSFQQVKACWHASTNREYDQLALVPHKHRAEWLAHHDILPTSRALLEQA